MIVDKNNYNVPNVVCLCRRNVEKHDLMLNVHHFVCDESMKVIVISSNMIIHGFIHFGSMNLLILCQERGKQKNIFSKFQRVCMKNLSRSMSLRTVVFQYKNI